MVVVSRYALTQMAFLSVPVERDTILPAMGGAVKVHFLLDSSQIASGGRM